MGQLVAFPCVPVPEPSAEAKTLAGLVGVIVTAQVDGIDLPEEFIRQEVEAALQEAGIPTFDVVDPDAMGHAGYLGLTLQAVRQEVAEVEEAPRPAGRIVRARRPRAGQAFAWAVRIELVQAVRLLRDPKSVWLGVTWSRGRMGVATRENLPACLNTALWEGIATFVRDCAESTRPASPG
jgi:hypothetical protein